MSTAELHTLTGAYALHALPEDERLAFERHLGACEACTQEVRELSATAARLGLAVSVVAPPAMRERVLREITTVRQEAPSHGRSGRSGAPAGRAGRWSTYALAACVAAAAAFGGVAVWQNQVARNAQEEAAQARQQNEQLARVLAAPDARTSSGALEGGARAAVVVSPSVNRAVFLASDMDRPPGGKVYQLWFNDDGSMRSAGLMDPSATDDTVLLDGPVDGASGMGITVEPAGGSKQPTTPPVALMDFPKA
ncbi:MULTISPECIES: anti-sigma factor [Streptomyces]|uniref:Regulator of SigK n=1 Tax=Streptomyces clavifer TaxID=68188 RepID=A0ABS4VFE4_9ACTN|nr:MULTISPECIES: anti-sigma factor [Streptomyces]KQX89824.1 anti-sigma factor [Streptomyces sp. Root1319]KQZ20482.1 anti-sigma factor [Streptomyces sp. Root55]MBP2362364.1 anti-sigma-K factor RskA [Streptomyces clavifer]MDX2745433.1 anti-sigma factor [Streptomyces sp. NRRL_B-2557]MDX3066655.1 anti-sigma factor [Streptomyces sp. ND04-05B]